jgi:hypothetical protein
MNAITTRYTPQVLERARAARASWRLRTEKFIGTAWQTMAVFPPAITEEQRGDQQKRLQRHAEAFGGLVRLMRWLRCRARYRAQRGRRHAAAWGGVPTVGSHL